MNAPIIQLATCPLCRRAIEFWPKNHPVQECLRCMRPLALIPVLPLKNKAFRIVSAYSLGKNITAIIALLALLSLSINLLHLRTLAVVVVTAFLVRGALETADGLAGLRSGIDFSWGRIMNDSIARRYSIAKIMAGLFLLALGVLGIGAQ